MSQFIEGLAGLEMIADKVAIASTMHEPNQSLLHAIARITPSLKDLGISWNIAMTAMTRDTGDRKEEFYNLLAGNFNVKVDADVFSKSPKGGMIEANHIIAYHMGVEAGKPFVLYTDSDRVSVAANYYPDEFARVVNTAVRIAEDENKVIALGRSPHATNTHISSLVLTERIIHYFYNKHLQLPAFVDSTSASYLVPATLFEQILSQYRPDETFLGVQSNYPQPKVLLHGATLGNGLAPLVTHNMLRYEAPEQFRGSGEIVVPNHEWTSEGYERVILASRPKQEAIMNNPGEWHGIGRFTNVHQFLDVLKILHLQPYGKKDEELDKVIDEVQGFTGKLSGEEYRAKAIELSSRYSYI